MMKSTLKRISLTVSGGSSLSQGKIYAATRLSDLNEKNFICGAKLLGEVIYDKDLYREWLLDNGLEVDKYRPNYNGVIE